MTHNDVPATVGLVKEVRKELRADIREVKEELKADIEELKGEIRRTEHKLSAEIQAVLSTVHRSQVLMEEQRSDNRLVLDGLKNVTERQDRVENDVVELRRDIKFLQTAKS